MSVFASSFICGGRGRGQTELRLARRDQEDVVKTSVCGPVPSNLFLMVSGGTLCLNVDDGRGMGARQTHSKDGDPPVPKQII